METEKKEGTPHQRTLPEKDLERMGFNFPKDMLHVIKEVVICQDEIDIVKLDRAISNFMLDLVRDRIKNQEVISICISNHCETSDHLLACIPYWWKFDHLLFIDRKWVPTADRSLQNEVIEAMRTGGSIEDVLKRLNSYTYKQSDSIDNPCEADSPNELKKAPESKKETASQSNSDDTDLRDAFNFCKDIFEEKLGLYGCSFCFMHPETVTDQLYMKATILKKRITDRDKGERFKYFFFEDVCGEFAAVVNYGIIALRQGGFCLPDSGVPESPMKFYTDQMEAALSLISEKGIEYGELWREVRIGTLADMIYTKVRRLKGIEDQYRFGSMTKEGYHKFAGDQYRDLINYGLFGVVRMTEIADVMAFGMEEDETDEEEGYE